MSPLTVHLVNGPIQLSAVIGVHFNAILIFSHLFLLFYLHNRHVAGIVSIHATYLVSG